MIGTVINEVVNVPLPDVTLEGELVVPEEAKGLVIFSHGAGSSRHSPRNKYVARQLEENRFGTFLFDLLTREEDRDYEKRFDIELLTKRLVSVTEWLQSRETLKGVDIAFFGASTGAASALNAAARLQRPVRAVISRGGRPDLAMDELAGVSCPVFLIVGEEDKPVIDLNKQAAAQLTKSEMVLIPGATHLFEEPGKLEEVARIAVHWLETKFS